MNRKYERYIDYIVNDLQAPYFKNMRDNYGLSPDEYELVLSKVFNQPVTIKGDYVYNNRGKKIYYENNTGYWVKREYYENNTGYWVKREYDNQGNEIYYENSNGNIIDKRRKI
jgi:hypothetical protein